MGGKAHGGARVQRAEVERLFWDRCELKSGKNQLFLCGSYRRGKPDCGDLDIVVVVRDREQFEQYLTEHFGLQKSGKKAARNGLIEGVQVEYYEAQPENLGTFLQMWTGSVGENVRLRRLALQKGYSMSQYGFRHKETGVLVQCATEEEVYDFLGTPFVVPSSR